MKHIVLALLWLAVPALAQAVVSPEVHADGRVTFHLSAPKVKDVRLNCEGVGNAAMTNDGHGLWTFTTEPLAPDIYVYSFNADGVRLLDPANSFLKYNLLDTLSQVEVPGPKSLPWEINDVPHGELHRHFYHSALAGDDRDYIVYTPPGYKPSSWKRYPVLYLLHGFSDDTTAWSAVGRANVMLDNLIARGQARPMIIVMPLGYGDMSYLKDDRSPTPKPGLREHNFDKFGEELLGEVIPQVQKDYRGLSNRRSRAIAGLSMGGAESLVVGLNHLDQFAWIGGFSSGRVNTNYPVQFPNLNTQSARQLRLLWIACGHDDHLLEPNQQLCGWLKSEGVPFTWVETPGVHSFRVWRRNLAAFAPLLFQEK